MTIEPIAESACAGTLLTKHAGRSLGQNVPTKPPPAPTDGRHRNCLIQRHFDALNSSDPSAFGTAEDDSVSISA
jgi:hypothetical protein